jgi:oligoribonuclease NrnB/cAMP/cGMP phosphodiesterase (DHH superfamily)
LLAAPGHGQSHPQRPPVADGTVAPVDADETRERLARDMAKKANVERQAALKNDTDKLVKLADELKEYVNKSNENILSLDVMKKAEEIEKLARSVKEKMKGAN